MKGNRDGQKPWSEDELFDLDSALAWGGNIEDIADFLGRDVVEIERKVSERNLLEGGEKRRAVASWLTGSTPPPLPQAVRRANRGRR
jgi:hypothetical protein